MKAACVQLRSGLNRAENTQHTASLIAQAANAGAQFILTPEMTNIVDRKPNRFFDEIVIEQEMEEIERFSILARDLSVYLMIGSMAVALGESDPNKAANRSFFFNPSGQLISAYDKIHMFDVKLPNGETWKESHVYTPGADLKCIHTNIGVFGQSICYDVRFPSLYRKLAQAGAQIITVPAAFTYQTGEAHWEVLLRARAIETGSFVVAAAQGGNHADGRQTWGHSMIIDPWGRILAEKPDQEEGFIMADIDLSLVEEARMRVPNLQLENEFNIINVERS